MIRFALWLALLPLLASCTATPVTPQRPLRLVSWNLEHLAEKEGSGCRPRTAADYAQLKQHAASLDADVVAFQEVESAAAAARVFDPAEYTIVIEARAGSSRRAECRGMPGRFLNRQAIGFAIKRGLAFDRAQDVTALSLGDPDLRGGVDVTVRPRDGRAVRLLSVHLKSGCASGSRSDACATLFRQLPVLESWVDARAGEGVRFAVLGDFNRRLSEPGDPFWAEIDDASPPAADLSLAAADRRPSCDPRYSSFIDHIALDLRAAGDLVRFQEHTYPGERLSDHCPVLAELHR